MKKNHLSLVACLFASMLWSCNSSNNTSSSGSDTTSSTTSTTTPAGGNPDTSTSSNKNNAANSTAATGMTLSKEDSTFVMKAAAGGMMEVELGNTAQQMATNPRVKNFGQMMVTDHSKANDELKSFASSKGITLPSDLPKDER